MSRPSWVLVVGGALAFGMGLVAGYMRAAPVAPAGQNSQSVAVGYGIVTYDIPTRQPMPESLAHLQFLADAVRCPVSDRSAIMASCVAQRYHKMRDKALLWRAKYERLEGLERAYWAALAREGLTQRIEHVRMRP